MNPYCLTSALNRVRETTPLIHCITNYVTVNDVANALLAIGGSPIMSDEPLDVVDITSICGGLTINIGTLNERTIEAMKLAAARANELDHPIVLDPVGAGASALRTKTAAMLLDGYTIRCIRGNMSEIKALVGLAEQTRGVDVNPDDVITEGNYVQNAAFARALAQTFGGIVAVTGAIDLVADGQSAYAIRNGDAKMGLITGSGCMLSAVTAAFITASPDDALNAVCAALCSFGLAGQQAAARMDAHDGVGSFRTYLLDALTTLDGETLERRARIEEIA